MRTALAAVLCLLASPAAACVERVERREVRGFSMGALAKEGETVTILYGAFRCSNPEPGGAVLYRLSGRETPVLKVVKAVPGDRFAIDGERLLINGRAAVTSAGEPFRLAPRAQVLLSLYQTDYRGIVPRDAFLLLGDLPEGTLDSTRFGFVHRDELVAKVVLPSR